MKSVVILQFLLTFVLSFSLSSLWGMLNGVAMIVYLPMFNGSLITIVTFDMIPKIDDINAYFFTTYFSEGDLH